MAGGVFQRYVRSDVTGASVPGASVRVRNESGGADAPIFSDAALTVSIANPMTADANGFFRFYVAAGKYRITATSGSFTADLRNEAIGSAQERDTGTDADDVILVSDADTRYLNAASDLSDLADVATARTNLGLGTMALEDAADYVLVGSLGTAAFVNVGTAAGEVPNGTILAGILADYTLTGDLGSMAFQDANAVVITGGDIIIDAFYVQGDAYFGGTAGDTANDYSVEILEVASAVNHLQLKGAVTTGAVEINSAGSDNGVNIQLTPKGAGNTIANGAGRVINLGTTELRSGGNAGEAITTQVPIALIIGADSLSPFTTVTTSVNKRGIYASHPYDLSQAKVAIGNTVNTSTANSLTFGGGAGSLQACTDLVFYTAATVNVTSGTQAMRIFSDQMSVFGTATSSDAINKIQVYGSVAVKNGAIALLAGADVGATTITNSTAKRGMNATPHYTNAEEPLALIVGDSTSSTGIVSIGGGNSALNAATEIAFYTAANFNTTTGTKRLTIDTAGDIFPPAGATAMATGFISIPAAAGAPSGVPTGHTGTVPLYYDTTNNKIYVYNGTWKQTAALT